MSFETTDTHGAPSNEDARTIDITAVDDPPTAADDSATVQEDASATSIPVLANDADPDGDPLAIASATDPANGTVVLTGGSPGAHTGLTYEPDPDYCNDAPVAGEDTFDYTLAGGDSATVSMTVTCVNDAPVADDEAFGGASSAVGNTTLVVNDADDGSPATPDPSDTSPATGRPHKTVSGDVLDGDTDSDGPGPLTVAPGTFATNDGGTVTIESDGDFTYEPAPSTSCADGSDFFDYTVTESGSSPQTDTGRVTIAIAGCVWYVNNDDAQGNSGTSEKPFDTLAQAEVASGAGHSIFVFDGDGTTTGYGAGIDLKASQKLIGEAATLTVGIDTLQSGDAGKRPAITDNNADVVALDDANEVRGLAIDPQGTGGGIAGGAGDTGGGTIGDVTIADTGTPGTQAGLELNGTTGTFNVSNLTIDNQATGVLLNSAGTVNFADTGTISITSTGARGLDATGTSMGSSTFDDISVSSSSSGAVSLVNTTGSTSLGDGTGGDLALTTTSGSAGAFVLSNAGSVTVPGGGSANISATAGPAVNVSGTPGASLDFDTVSSSNSTGSGISLVGLGTGTFSATGGAIGGAAAPSFNVNGGSGAVSYGGALNDGTSGTASIVGRTGGTVTLSGTITDSSDAGGGIAATGNSGGTTSLTGDNMALSTGASPGIDASGGTLVVTGSNNNIASTTGRALNLNATQIGASGLTFRSISSNGSVNGISLSGTGNAGSLTVTGSGSSTLGGDDSGGTIQNTTGPGIALANTLSPSFRNMKLLDTGDSAVNGTGVSGFRFTDGRLTGAGNADDENSITFDDATGTNVSGLVTITNNVIEGTEAGGVDIQNFSGTISDANISGNDLSDGGATTTAGSAISLIANGTAGSAASVTKAELTNNTISDFRAGAGFVVQGGNTTSSGAPGGTIGTPGSGTNVIAVTGNSMNGGAGGTGNQPDRFFTGGVSGNGQGNFNVSNNGTAGNRVRNIDCIAIELTADGLVTMNSTVQNNFINANSAVGCAGISVGTDQRFALTDSPQHTATISGNNVMGTDGPGIFPIVRNSSGTMTVKVLNNTVAAPSTTNAARAGIRVDSGSAAGDTTLCLEITGNTTGGSTNSATSTTSPGINLRKQGTDPTINTFGIEGMVATASPGVENYVNALNTSSSGTFGVGGTALLSAQSGFTNCNAP